MPPVPLKVLLPPSDAAKKAIKKAHEEIEKALRKMNDSLVISLRGSGYGAVAFVIVQVQVYDKKTTQPIGTAHDKFSRSIFMETVGTETD